MQENEPKAKAPASTEVPTLNLTFNLDGTIDPEQLVGLPQELIDRVSDPAFQKEAEARIRSHRMQALAIHRFKERAAGIRKVAEVQHQARRPDGVSGRQRKRLRRAARKAASVTLKSNPGGNSNAERELPNHKSSPAR